MSEPNSEKAPIIGLDIIRFSAAAMVMWFHLTYMTWAGSSTPYRFSGGLFEFRSLAPISNWGWIGVQIFFVLSGFVIAFSAQGKSGAAFARSRFLRLYPGAWASCAVIAAICVALHLTATSPYAAKDLATLFVKSAALWPIAPWLDGVFWTLGVELAFYTSIFVLLCFGRFDKIDRLLTIIGTISAFAIFAVALGAPFPIRARWAELLMLPHGIYFAIGGFLWIATQRRIRQWEKALLAAFVIAGFCEIASWSASLGVPAFVPCIIWFAATVAVHVAVQHNDRIIASLPRGSAPVCRNLGLATYPLYLVHSAVGAATMQWAVMAGASQHAALAIGLATPIIVALVIGLRIEPALRKATAGLTTALSLWSRPKRQHQPEPN